MKAMIRNTLLGAALLAIAAPTAQAATKSVDLPADSSAQWAASPLPGYKKVLANCVACHSAEYIEYQPPNASRTYWDAMVKRMKAAFKAPIDDADMPDIVDYLVKTYGNEQPK